MKKKLLNTTQASGFKIPENYFEGLEDKMLTQIHLETQSKSSGFKVPEDYFDTIEASVLSKINKPEPKVYKLFTKKTLLSVSSIAAALMLFYSLNLFKSSPTTLDALDTDTVENYILDEIELNDLNLLINDTELSQTDFIDYNTIEVDDYLDDIDLNDFYQE
ncbi:hypothetical protein DZC78_05185 [Olleya aquimaris]|uniref:Uncharacterized protein n=1 Tax=Olleya sediminilitoris TaxID=2795739 RepID=A0ABS1WJQ9_9FLAO|nr:hypothetical protein [Olleya sediminilitoris]AXO79804.1 hypothetical protein DZC78_05185 [Olleya aquimaris]MBL7559359.1 hypothetical protein [Olleya sediminilitoris]